MVYLMFLWLDIYQDILLRLRCLLVVHMLFLEFDIYLYSFRLRCLLVVHMLFLKFGIYL